MLFLVSVSFVRDRAPLNKIKWGGGGRGRGATRRPYLLPLFPATFRSGFFLCSISVVKCKILCDVAIFQFLNFSRTPSPWELASLPRTLPAPYPPGLPPVPLHNVETFSILLVLPCLHIFLQPRMRLWNSFYYTFPAGRGMARKKVLLQNTKWKLSLLALREDSIVSLDFAIIQYQSNRR